MDKAGELEAHWRGHVDAWRASGDSQKAYCEQHGLRSHTLSYWHRRLAKGPVSSAAGNPLTLVPAVRGPSAAAAAPILSLHSPQGWRLELATLPPAGWVTALWEERS